MDYLQYMRDKVVDSYFGQSVLNLIINGLPSILLSPETLVNTSFMCFKPYYKWITFNTLKLS